MGDDLRICLYRSPLSCCTACREDDLWGQSCFPTDYTPWTNMEVENGPLEDHFTLQTVSTLPF